jgi:hypothetical protein
VCPSGLPTHALHAPVILKGGLTQSLCIAFGDARLFYFFACQSKLSPPGTGLTFGHPGTPTRDDTKTSSRLRRSGFIIFRMIVFCKIIERCLIKQEEENDFDKNKNRQKLISLRDGSNNKRALVRNLSGYYQGGVKQRESLYKVPIFSL